MRAGSGMDLKASRGRFIFVSFRRIVLAAYIPERGGLCLGVDGIERAL